ncbi:MAG: DegT/DnrJ/EryC1/StrS family aminotransferase [Thermomicrobiales bacterium]
MAEQLAVDGGRPVRTRPFGPTHDFGDEDIAALAEVIHSGNIGKGPRVAAFERAFAARHGLPYGISVTSGTAAMHTCIGVLNPEPGDEIIVSPWTSGGSLIGALWQNCVPVFADIDDTYTLDPRDVEAKITPRTRAIIAVHLFGNPCDMDALRAIARRHDIALIEDCCQALDAEYQGQRVGALGDIAGFSFGGKHLSAGMGGMVITGDDTLGQRAQLFADVALPRPNGPYAGRPYANYFLGQNYRINDLLGALLLAQLEKVEGYIARKVQAAQWINAQLADLPELTPQRVRPGDRHCYWVSGWTLDTNRLGVSAWDFAATVTAEGVPLGGPYIGSSKEGPLYRNPFLAEPACYGTSWFPFDYGREQRVDYEQVVCPAGEALMQRSMVLSMLPSFTADDLADIVTALRKVTLACRERAARRVSGRSR